MDAGVVEHGVEPGGVGALGQPEAGGIVIKTFAVGLDTDLDLGVRDFGGVEMEGEDGVGGGGGGDFEDTEVLEMAEGVEDVSVETGGEEVFDLLEAVAVEAGEVSPPGLAEGAVAADVVVGEEDGAFEVVDEARLEERVAHHGGEGGGEGEGDLEVGDAVVFEAGEDVEEREVGFGEGFEEPVFFEEAGVFGVADEGEVGVEDEGEVGPRLWPWGGGGGGGGVGGGGRLMGRDWCWWVRGHGLKWS